MSAAELAKWEERYRANAAAPLADPEPFVVDAVDALPVVGSAVDLAGGSGRHALWLAERGWVTTLVDVSPTAVEIARDAAKRRALQLRAEVLDLDDADPAGGPWDLVVVHHYLNRELLARVHRLLRPGGRLVVCHPTLRNLERHPRPAADLLLGPGELPTLLGGLTFTAYFEGWTAQGRHEARAVATLDAPG